MTNEAKQADVNDRYAALQRKLDDLQRLHTEGKKSYHTDLERLKGELSRAKKANGEETERLDRMKKLKDATELRMQELKKASVVDQAEIKDLRNKLRIAENGRAQMSAKQGQMGDVKKALQDLESKRREELKLRDKHITDLEKSLAGERRKREAAEAHTQELREKAEHDLSEARGRVQKLEFELKDSRFSERKAIEYLETEKEHTSCRQEQLLSQMNSLRGLLKRVTEEYGRLASSSVSSSTHSALKNEHIALQVRSFRLERKLANSEAQVLELANLIRQTKDDNTALLSLLRAVSDEVGFYTNLWKEALASPSCTEATGDLLTAEVSAAQHDISKFQLQVQETCARAYEECYRFSRWATRDLLLAYRSCTADLDQSQFELKQSTINLDAARSKSASLTSELRTLRGELDCHLRQHGELSAALSASDANAAALAQQLQATVSKLDEAQATHDTSLKKEREIVQRLASTVQKSKTAEEALRAEIDQLTGELTDAERYQEAYFNLMEQVEALVARNELAEEEAKRLSKFNAEILGHNNPAQRIMYLDRIRRELAETKQDLLTMTRERDAAAAYGDTLQHELDMYKSVAVPPEMKPRTAITRVARIPLAVHSTNVVPTSHSVTPKFFDPVGGDMTLDEII